MSILVKPHLAFNWDDATPVICKGGATVALHVWPRRDLRKVVGRCRECGLYIATITTQGGADL